MPELASPPAAGRPEPKPTAPDLRPRHCYTVEEYLSFERGSPTKHEYYAGTIYAMTGASRRHVLIVTNVVSWLDQQTRDRPCEVYSSEMRVKVSPTGLYTYPDLAVVCGEPRFEDAEVDTLLNPRVVIEVLSKSTKDSDLGDKFDHYRAVESVTDYVLISQDARRVEHRSRQVGGEWTVATHDGAEAVVPLDSIDCTLPLSEIYRRIQFGS